MQGSPGPAFLIHHSPNIKATTKRMAPAHLRKSSALAEKGKVHLLLSALKSPGCVSSARTADFHLSLPP
eukprot:1160401-Pelagomonas_calceolata.AAC.2